jgi:ATP-dependent Clp protease ATP-binding subunit ClpB
MLRFDKLTVKGQEALQAAQEMGARSGQQQIEPLHLLWALTAQGDGVVPPLAESFRRIGPVLEPCVEHRA